MGADGLTESSAKVEPGRLQAIVLVGAPSILAKHADGMTVVQPNAAVITLCDLEIVRYRCHFAKRREDAIARHQRLLARLEVRLDLAVEILGVAVGKRVH